LPPIEYLLAFFALLLMSLSIHEAAHAWTADRLGDPTARLLGRITLNPMAHIDWIGTVLFPLIAIMSDLPLLGWAKPVPVNVHRLRAPRRDFAVIAAAGPASNLLIALAGAALVAVVDPDGLGGSLAGAVLRQAVFLNVLLAVFNMIPVPPLDGGNVLSGILPEQFARLIDQLRPWGFLLLYALLLTGMLSRYVFPIAYAIVDRLIPVL
jgi:Zn-dependent protease